MTKLNWERNVRMEYFKRKDITLYHGSCDIVKKVDFNKCKKQKDFGRGFYLTSSKFQAEKFANTVANRAKKFNSKYVNIFDARDLLENVNYKIFNTADIEWLDFVVANRMKRNMRHDYDIIIGLIADDNTDVVLTAYMEGLYGDLRNEKVKKYAIELLETGNLKNQVCICTHKGLKKYSMLGVIGYER